MNFGVSGTNIGWNNLAIHRNPVTVAAIKRMQEKERLANDAAYRARKEQMTRIKAQVAADQEAREERFRREFLYNIAKLRMIHQENRLLDYRVHLDTGLNRKSIKDVIAYHANLSGFSYSEIVGPRRNKKLVVVRHQAMADAYVLCPHLSLPSIGQAFGGRDHSSVWWAVKKMGVHHSQTSQYGTLRDAA